MTSILLTTLTLQAAVLMIVGVASNNPIASSYLIGGALGSALSLAVAAIILL
jgi:hypothetical protein